MMTKIDLKDLDPKLREHVERVRAGETILVMDHGEVVADLVPHNATRRVVLEAVAQGEMRWNGGKPKGLSGIVVRGESMSDTVVRGRR